MGTFISSKKKQTRMINMKFMVLVFFEEDKKEMHLGMDTEAA